MGVPVGSSVPEERCASVDGPLIPPVAGGGAEGIDGLTPVVGGCGGGADRAERLCGGVGVLEIGCAGCIVGSGMRGGVGVPLWQPATARDRGDGTGVIAVAEREHNIERGESGAQEQNGRFGVEILQRARRPGIARVAGGACEIGVGIGWGSVSDGEDAGVGVDGIGVRGGDNNGGSEGVGAQLDGLIVDDRQRGWWRGAPGIIEGGSKVRAEDGSWEELGCIDGAVERARGPGDEVFGSIGEGGHSSGGNVEQVRGARGGVGDAGTGIGGALEDGDSGAGADEVDCTERAGASAADDDDAGLWGHGVVRASGTAGSCAYLRVERSGGE